MVYMPAVQHHPGLFGFLCAARQARYPTIFRSSNEAEHRKFALSSLHRLAGSSARIIFRLLFYK